MYILEDLWRGCSVTYERSEKESAEFAEALADCNEAEDKLLALLDDEGKAAFQEYLECQQALEVLTDRETFIKAARFGSFFMMDVFGKEANIQGDAATGE